MLIIWDGKGGIHPSLIVSSDSSSFANKNAVGMDRVEDGTAGHHPHFVVPLVFPVDEDDTQTVRNAAR